MMKKFLLLAVAAMMATTTLTSCSDNDDIIDGIPDQSVVLNCAKPDYLKAGDKVALISPSYYTPMENVEKTADVRPDGATLQFNIDGEQQQVNTSTITAPATPAAVRMRLAGKME